MLPPAWSPVPLVCCLSGWRGGHCLRESAAACCLLMCRGCCLHLGQGPQGCCLCSSYVWCTQCCLHPDMWLVRVASVGPSASTAGRSPEFPCSWDVAEGTRFSRLQALQGRSAESSIMPSWRACPSLCSATSSMPCKMGRSTSSSAPSSRVASSGARNGPAKGTDCLAVGCSAGADAAGSEGACQGPGAKSIACAGLVAATVGEPAGRCSALPNCLPPGLRCCQAGDACWSYLPPSRA